MGQFMNRPQSQQLQDGEQQPQGQEAAWWCKILARGVTSIGAGIACVLGITAALSINKLCIGAGILQVILALIVLVIELPCCFTWIDIARPIANFAENRSFLQKAIFYGIASLIPIGMCFGLSTLFGSGLIFAGAVLYGLMGLGRKADRDEMMRRAAADSNIEPGPTAEQTPDNTKDDVNLVI